MLKWDKWQEDILKTEGDRIICTGRQIGKSEVCAADAVEYAVSHPKSKPIVMIAPLEKQAFALFTKALNYLTDKYPRLICKGKDKPTQTRIKLTSGVEILCLPVGTGLNIRFLTIGRLYIDEAARVSPEIFTAIQPALLTTGGYQIWISTLNGAQGDFYDCWINKDQAYSSFTRFSKSTEEAIAEREICPTWTEQQKEGALQKLEQAKSRMSKAEYGQEYLGIAAQNLSRVFNDQLIKSCCALKRRGRVLSDRKHYCGADISGLGEAENVISIMDKIDNENIEQVESIISKRVYTTDTSKKIIFLNREYKFKSIGIDDGGVGFGVYCDLMDCGDTKRKTIALNNASRETSFEGETSKRILKEEMYMLMLAYMEQNKVHLLDDEEIIESFKSIQFELIQKPGEITKTRIFGNYSHCVESIIRALWLAVEDKSLNIWVR